MTEEHAKGTCFVICPIGEPNAPVRTRADQLIKYIIEPVCGKGKEGLGYMVVRADLEPTPGQITRRILERVANDALVIADLTGHNPNVFYELAVRHAAQKPYVQLIDINESLPFDLKDEVTIFFDIRDLDSVDECKNKLRALVAASTAPDFEIKTPIGRALELHAAKTEGGTPAMLAQQLEDLQASVNWITRQLEPLLRPVPTGTQLDFARSSLLGPAALLDPSMQVRFTEAVEALGIKSKPGSKTPY